MAVEGDLISIRSLKPAIDDGLREYQPPCLSSEHQGRASNRNEYYPFCLSSLALFSEAMSARGCGDNFSTPIILSSTPSEHKVLHIPGNPFHHPCRKTGYSFHGVASKRLETLGQFTVMDGLVVVVEVGGLWRWWVGLVIYGGGGWGWWWRRHLVVMVVGRHGGGDDGLVWLEAAVT
ncbi:hypothetical protein Tco_1523644 [Tanacetum coccineum]